MRVTELRSFDIVCNSDNTFVLKAKAIIDDYILVHQHNWIEPPEYGPALCRTEVILYDYDGNLLTNDDVINYLNESDVDWILDEDDWSQDYG